MTNKNIIAGLIVLGLIVGGLAFYFMGGNKTTGVSAPVSTTGELTRPLARQLIADYYATDADGKDEKIVDVIVTGIKMEDASNALVSFDVERDEAGQVVKITSPVPMPFSLYDNGWRVDVSRYYNR